MWLDNQVECQEGFDIALQKPQGIWSVNVRNKNRLDTEREYGLFLLLVMLSRICSEVWSMV